MGVSAAVPASGAGLTTLKPVLWLCALSVVMSLTMSAPILQSIGIHYATPGGNPIIKIHPSSWVTMAAFGLFLVHRAGDGARLAAWIGEAGWLLFTAFTVLATLVYKILCDGLSGSAFMVDSYLAPALLLMMLIEAPPGYRRRLAGLAVALLVVNAILGIGEASLEARLFKFSIKGKAVVEAYFRATALNGHPLQNALLTSCALIALVALDWPLLIRMACAAVLGLGLLAFGGRAATVIGVCGALYVLAGRVGTYVRQGPAALAFASWALGIVGSAVVAGAAVVLTVTDLGGRLFNTGIDDSSAMARADLTNLFDNIRFDDVMAGYSSDDIDQITAASHLPDIECFWIYMLFYLGVIGFVIWLIGFLAQLGFVWRRIDGAGRTIVACVVLIASTSVSLHSKDTLLSTVFALVVGTGLTKFRPQPR